MKSILSISFVLLLVSCASMRSTSHDIDQVVEVSCGTCQLSMAGDECQLAIRVDGKAYYVEGSSLDDHGNAHGENGMCNVVRNAHVKGTLKHGVYMITSVKLIEVEE